MCFKELFEKKDYKGISKANDSSVDSGSNELFIIANSHGIIQDISDSLLSLLKYERDVLNSQFIGILMSPFMSYLHTNVYFPKYNKLNRIQKNIVHVLISALSESRRPLIIYDINKNPIYVHITAKLVAINVFKATFECISDIYNDNLLSKPIGIVKSDAFAETNMDVVLISIDFKNSTETLMNYGTRDYIALNRKFYNDVVYLIKQYYYPYIYIHEVIGDCFVFVLNSDWTYNLTNYCASLAYSFLVQLYKVTSKYVNTRIGVVCDKLLYGYIGNNFRLFGPGMHKVNRLENICELGHIACDENFVNKLRTENLFKDNSVTAKKGELKGLGDSVYYDIELCDKNLLEDIFQDLSDFKTTNF